MEQIKALGIDLATQVFHLVGINHAGDVVLKPKTNAAQFVTPFRKGCKNDLNDAEAIFITGSQPQMRFVPVKTVEQQDIQALHRIRSQAIVSRTALSPAQSVLRKRFRNARQGPTADTGCNH